MDRSYTRFILRRTHAGLGITAAVFFYIALFFGTICMVSPCLGIWEKPSRYFSPPARFDLDAVIRPHLAGGLWPDTGVSVTLPGPRDPAVTIGHRFEKPLCLHPETGAVLKDEGRGLLRFFINLHQGRVLGLTGVRVMGVVCTAVLFLTLNGWWLIRVQGDTTASFFKWSRGGWLRWHRKLSLWLSPVLLILALTSSFFGLMFSFGGGLAYVASQGKSASIHAVLGPAVFPKTPLPAPTGSPAEMVSLNRLFQTASQEFETVRITRIGLDHWGDENAVVTFSGPLKALPFLTERVNRLFISYRGADGTLIRRQTLEDVSWIKVLLSGFYFLHFLTDAGPVLRLAMFLCGAGLCLATGACVLSWRRRVTGRKKHTLGRFLLSRMLTTVFLGLFPATAAVLLLQWLVPPDLPRRMVWIQGGLYLSWQAGLVWSLARDNGREIAGGFIGAAGGLLCAVPLAHGLATGFFVWTSLKAHLWGLAGIDASLLVLGAAGIWGGRRLWTGPLPDSR